MLHEALAGHPGHVGVRDDLFWWHDRAGNRLEFGEERERHVRTAFEIAEALHADSPDRMNRADMQLVAVGAIGDLAMTYQFLGRHDDAHAAAQRLIDLARDAAIAWVPQGRAELDRVTARVRAAGLMHGGTGEGRRLDTGAGH